MYKMLLNTVMQKKRITDCCKKRDSSRGTTVLFSTLCWYTFPAHLLLPNERKILRKTDLQHILKYSNIPLMKGKTVICRTSSDVLKFSDYLQSVCIQNLSTWRSGSCKHSEFHVLGMRYVMLGILQLEEFESTQEDITDIQSTSGL